jgi:hypothetical protein
MDVSISHDPFQPDLGDFTKPRKVPKEPQAKDAAPVTKPAPNAEPK